MAPDLPPAALGRTAATRAAWSRWAVTGLLAAGLFAALALFEVPDNPALTPCLFKRATGVACMTCGMTRAAACLAKGRLGAAVQRHPLAPLLAFEAALAWLAWGAVLAGKLRRPTPRLVRALVLGNLALLALTWLVRLATKTLPP